MKPGTLPRDFGSYRLIRLLGKGAMGAVFLGEQRGPLGFSRHVAIKLVDPFMAARRPDLLLSLSDEATLLSNLRHPHIVGLQGFEEVQDADWGSVHALILEFIDGCPVETLMRPAGRRLTPVPAGAALKVLEDVLAGLAHAHTATKPDGTPLGLVHRDLKPLNLLVDRSGTTRILDFGIAWATERLVETAAGVTKGTLSYMSPEQVAGSPLDGRSDLYALGAVAFEMITAREWVAPPSTPKEIGRAAHAVMAADYAPRAAEVREALEPALGTDPARRVSDWLSRMLAKRRSSRFADAREARAELIVRRPPLRPADVEWLARTARGDRPAAVDRGAPTAPMPVPPRRGSLPPAADPVDPAALDANLVQQLLGEP